MKNIILLLSTLALFSYSSSQAQGLHLGIKASSDLSEVTGSFFQNGLKGGLMTVFRWNIF
jgi:hypothetical protein